jgi:hypothetical protein
MLFATPDDVAALQTNVKQQVKAISSSISDCAKAGTLAGDDLKKLVHEWKVTAKRAAAYLAEDPSWIDAQSQYDRGVALVNELQPGWYQRLEALKCEAPPQPSPPPAPLRAESWAEGWTGMVALVLVVVALHEFKGL